MTGRAARIVGLAAAVLGASACVSGEPPCESCVADTTGTSSGAGAGACNSSRGTLSGAVVLGQAGGAPATNALVVLRRSIEDVPLHAKADADGSFSVEIESGDWIVTAEDESAGCSTEEPAAVVVAPCGSTVQHLSLDLCFG